MKTQGTDFADLHIVVTGGTGALGSAVVGALLDQGATCHIPWLDKGELDRFPYDGHDNVHLVKETDLTNDESVRSLYHRFAEHEDLPAGQPDLWASIHIAGGFDMGPITETTSESFQKLMNMNARTCFLCCREAVRRIRAGGQGGRIVNVAARPALSPETGGQMVAYTASKAAVAAITQSLASEVAAEGILVNAVAPSIMDTAANRKAMPDADHTKWPTTQEVAQTILFLASPANTTTRGGLIPTYGRA